MPRQDLARKRGYPNSTVPESISEKVRIVYAGGVTSDNCADYARCDDIDGCLVGAASLRS